MQNDNSRQWAVLAPFVPGEVLTARAQQVEAAGMFYIGTIAETFYG